MLLYRSIVSRVRKPKNLDGGFRHFLNRLPNGGEAIARQCSHRHIVVTDDRDITGYAQADFTSSIDAPKRHHVAGEENGVRMPGLPQQSLGRCVSGLVAEFAAI